MLPICRQPHRMIILGPPGSEREWYGVECFPNDRRERRRIESGRNREAHAAIIDTLKPTLYATGGVVEDEAPQGYAG